MNNEHNRLDNELDATLDDSPLYLYHLYRKSEFMFLGGEPLSEQWATERRGIRGKRAGYSQWHYLGQGSRLNCKSTPISGEDTSHFCFAPASTGWGFSLWCDRSQACLLRC